MSHKPRKNHQSKMMHKLRTNHKPKMSHKPNKNYLSKTSHKLQTSRKGKTSHRRMICCKTILVSKTTVALCYQNLCSVSWTCWGVVLAHTWHSHPGRAYLFEEFYGCCFLGYFTWLSTGGYISFGSLVVSSFLAYINVDQNLQRLIRLLWQFIFFD